jgi:hypothetical protein
MTIGPIPFHPMADIFPLLEGEQFEQLVADIKENGLREKMDTYRGKIVDGRNRYRALRQLGINPDSEPDKYFRKAIYVHRIGGEVASHEQSNDDLVRAYIISKNIHRRHLTPEQRRDLVAKLLKADPGKSDRDIARQVKADHKTVAAVRAEGESTGEIPQLEKRVGADGKARKQPTMRPAHSVEAPTPGGVTGSVGSVQMKPSRRWQKTVWEHALSVSPDLVLLRDFAQFTITNVRTGKLKLDGDPETARRWRDLIARVESILTAATASSSRH